MRSAIFGLILVVGCGSRSGPDLESDASPDDARASEDSVVVDSTTPIDIGFDSGFDSGLDSTIPFPEDGALPGDAIVPPPDAFGDAVPPPDGAPPVGCPAALPAAGATCSGSTECAYRGCNPTSADRARCISGRWAVAAAACSSICPVGVPADGAACVIDSAYMCMFDNGCPEGAVGQCVGGRWSVKSGGCPKTWCAEPIVEGGACSPSGVACLHGSSCGHISYVFCDVDRWYIGFDWACDARPGCPSVRPVLGGSCPYELECGYANACGSVDSYSCMGGIWREFPGRCTTTSCPAIIPLDGSTCSGSATCAYPVGGGCEVDCRCDAGHWLCRQPPCGASLGK